MKGLITLVIGITVTIILATIAFPVILVNAGQQSAGIEPLTAQQLLGSTVQIRMYAPAPGQPDKESVANGLGTVVRVGDNSYIVTHNHWGFIYETLTRVELWDANRQTVVTLNATALQQLVRHSDAGTLIISTPPGLAIVATELSDSQSLGMGDVVQIVHHPAGSKTEVEVIEAVVMVKSRKEGLPTVILHSLDNKTIVNGDSGGGIWHNGQLVGNMWMTINSAISQEATEISVVATMPASAQDELTVQSQPVVDSDSDGSHLSQLLLEG